MPANVSSNKNSADFNKIPDDGNDSELQGITSKPNTGFEYANKEAIILTRHLSKAENDSKIAEQKLIKTILQCTKAVIYTITGCALFLFVAYILNLICGKKGFWDEPEVAKIHDFVAVAVKYGGAIVSGVFLSILRKWDIKLANTQTTNNKNNE